MPQFPQHFLHVKIEGSITRHEAEGVITMPHSALLSIESEISPEIGTRVAQLAAGLGTPKAAASFEDLARRASEAVSRAVAAAEIGHVGPHSLVEIDEQEAAGWEAYAVGRARGWGEVVQDRYRAIAEEGAKGGGTDLYGLPVAEADAVAEEAEVRFRYWSAMAEAVHAKRLEIKRHEEDRKRDRGAEDVIDAADEDEDEGSPSPGVRSFTEEPDRYLRATGQAGPGFHAFMVSAVLLDGQGPFWYYPPGSWAGVAVLTTEDKVRMIRETCEAHDVIPKPRKDPPAV
jgi:hypothetical protein